MDPVEAVRVGPSSAGWPTGVELNHEFPVRGAGGGQFVAAVSELGPQVGDFLFELSDALLNGAEVVWGAEPRLVPGLLADGLGESAFELGDAAGHARVAFGEVGQVREEGLAADLRAAGSGVGLGGAGQHGGVQVCVPIDQAAVHSGAACDSRDADLVAVGAEVVEGLHDAAATAGGVLTPDAGEWAGR